MAGSLRIAEQHLCSLQCSVLCAGLRRATIAAAASRRSRLSWTISWLGFGLSDKILLMRYPWGKVCYPWGKVHYPLFGYLAQGLLPE
jgi:hypothetical protein